MSAICFPGMSLSIPICSVQNVHTVQTEPLDLSVRRNGDRSPGKHKPQVMTTERCLIDTQNRVGKKFETLNNIIKGICKRTARTSDPQPAGEGARSGMRVSLENRPLSSIEKAHDGENSESRRSKHSQTSKMRKLCASSPSARFRDSGLQPRSAVQFHAFIPESWDSLMPSGDRHQAVRSTPLCAWNGQGSVGQVRDAHSTHGLGWTQHRFHQCSTPTADPHTTRTREKTHSEKVPTHLKRHRYKKSHKHRLITGRENRDTKRLAISSNLKYACEIDRIKAILCKTDKKVPDTFEKGPNLKRLLPKGFPLVSNQFGISWPVIVGCSSSSQSEAAVPACGNQPGGPYSVGDLSATPTTDVEKAGLTGPQAPGPMRLPVKLPASDDGPVPASVTEGLGPDTQQTLHVATPGIASSRVDTDCAAHVSYNSLRNKPRVGQNIVIPKRMNVRKVKPKKMRSLLFDSLPDFSIASSPRESSPYPCSKRSFSATSSFEIGQEMPPVSSHFTGFTELDAKAAPSLPSFNFPYGYPPVSSQIKPTRPPMYGFPFRKKDRPMTIYSYDENAKTVLASQIDLETKTHDTKNPSIRKHPDVNSYKLLSETPESDRALLEQMRVSGLISRHASGCPLLLAQIELAKTSRNRVDFYRKLRGQQEQEGACECTPCKTCRVMFRSKYRVFSHQMRGCEATQRW
ncbi:hypothetical protein EGW08_011522 [Elysia chlorotica]|uniref:Uncharacterized protein n=1 Tax=Elysia chlorotica TaxID=188477 RepID=A0A3S1BD10_ELYCH|nr:hypothetical protein EGW08_011522 [Elysia chlorotica]